MLYRFVEKNFIIIIIIIVHSLLFNQIKSN